MGWAERCDEDVEGRYTVITRDSDRKVSALTRGFLEGPRVCVCAADEDECYKEYMDHTVRNVRGRHPMKALRTVRAYNGTGSVCVALRSCCYTIDKDIWEITRNNTALIA